MTTRLILHCDMNNFYASVACLQDPSLRNIPVAVCGDPSTRHGIVLSKNMLAKAAGVQTGEPIIQALRKCPMLKVVVPEFSSYHTFSKAANQIYNQYTDRVEPFGIDESWLDLTGCVSTFSQAIQQAYRIKARIYAELGVTVSIGVSFNKVFAKLGSDLKKPDAVTPISPAAYQSIVWPLPTRELLFIGPSTQRRLSRMGIFTIGDLAKADPGLLHTMLGKWGDILHAYANGLDMTPVAVYGAPHEIKSIGNSITTSRDMTTREDIAQVCYMLCESVAERMRAHALSGTTLSIWLRDAASLSSFDRQIALPGPTHLSSVMAPAALQLFDIYWDGRPLRSIGIRMLQLSNDGEAMQLNFLHPPDDRTEALENCIDTIRNRFGRRSIERAISMVDRGLGVRTLRKPSSERPISFASHA